MKPSKSIEKRSGGKRPGFWWRDRAAVAVAVVLTLLFSSTALAAQMVSGDTYVLPRGEVVSDDLYVAGGEVIIDGTVEGDLVVAGGYVEINGVVMGDLLAMGGAVVIAGTVQDDVRATGGAVVLSGTVGDDFVAAAGGGWPGAMAMPMMSSTVGGRQVPQGLQMTSGSSVGGDAFVAAGQGVIAGSIGSRLAAGMGTLTFSGRVAGDADLDARTLTVLEGAVVQGELRYSTVSDTVIPEGVAASVVAQPRSQSVTEPTSVNPIWGFLRWLLRSALLLAGYLLVGWLVWSLAPRQIATPTAVIETRPVEAGITGLLAAVAVLPIGAALAFVATLFWGWFPGGVILIAFVFGVVAFVWLFSPVFTGMWVGRKIAEATGIADGELARLLLGITVIVLGARLLTVVPCIGDLAFQMIFLVSFALCVGSWFLARQRPPQEPEALAAPIVPAV